MWRISVFILACSLTFACASASLEKRTNINKTPLPTTAPVNSSIAKATDKIANTALAAACQTVDTGDYVVLKNQTFAFDHEPYKGSCFVTAHNPEYDEPPMEAVMAIYKDGKKVFDFPAQFNGVTFGCWVDAVAFEDLNGDKLTDVIVVGKCSAKTAPYNENMVYINNGKTFTTREDANYKLAELKKAKDVADFVKVNKAMFFE